MRNVIWSTPRIREILAAYACEHGDDVAATSPWVQGDCEMLHRVVLRDTGGSWVVHTQGINLPDGVAHFASGFYYPKPPRSGRTPGPDTDAAFARAWATFERRCRNHLGINSEDAHGT